ncbi:MAG: PilZ domain-containing protein [Desulfobacterales bacterium]|jgi:hypothetical protein
MNYIEKRKMERFDLKLPALISMMDVSGKPWAAEFMIGNICAEGAFFKTDQPLSVGTDVKMDLILPFDKLKKFGKKGSRIDVSGSVIRTDDQGMAVCFGKNFKISTLNT